MKYATMLLAGVSAVSFVLNASVAPAAPKQLVLFDAASNAVERAGTYAFARGAWDVSAYGEIVVEFEKPLPPGVSFCVRLENEGAEHGDVRGNHSRGVFETISSSGNGLSAGAWKLPPYVEDFQRCLCDMYGVRSSGLQYLIWPNPLWATWSMQGIGASRIRSWTLDPRHVVKAGVERLYPGLYAPPPGSEAPQVKRIVMRGEAPKIIEDHLPPFAKLPPEKFFPFIDKYGQFVHNDWPGKIKGDGDFGKVNAEEEKDLAAHPGPKDWDKWGGWAEGPKLKATGHFRVEKVDGKWWFVDPDGRLWWSHGPVRVSASSGMTPVEARRDKFFAWLPPKEGDEYSAFYKTRDELMWPYYIKFGCTNTFDFTAANLRRKYGPDWFAAWSDKAHRRLRSWGANTIANSSDIRVARQGRTPYTDRFELKSRPIAGTEKVVAWWPFRDPFDPGFRPEVRRQMKLHEAEMNDPWCFGFFVDNELPWGAPDALGRQTWDSPEDQPARRAFVKWLEEKYGTAPAEPSKEDCVAFSAVIAHAYFRGVSEEFKAMAPHKLYMGCRFTGGGCFAMPIAAQYCDVVSCNYYRKDLSGLDMPNFDKPFIIGEFHVSALDRGPIEPGLIMVSDQKARADVYRRYFRSALSDPRCIGAHWHQFSDDVPTGRYDGENFQIGWVDVCDTPYVETIAAVRDIGYDLYRFRRAAPVVRQGEPFSDHMVLHANKPNGTLTKVETLPVACTARGTVAGEAPSLLPDGMDFALAWHDEFNGDALDTSKWSYRTNFWGKRFMAFAGPEDGCVEVKGGKAHLKLKKRADGHFCSPQLQTGELMWDIPWDEGRKGFWPLPKREPPKFVHRYGYYECRCRLQRRPGWWSAFWMQSETQGACLDAARAGIEHDIMESFSPGCVSRHCFHRNGYGADYKGFSIPRNGGGKTPFTYGMSTDEFHTFGLLWEPDGYTVFVDGRRSGEKAGAADKGEAVSHVPEFVLISTECQWYRQDRMTGRAVEELEESARLGDDFVVDYVRVYDVVGK